MVIIIPPPDQKFDKEKPGFVYTVEYECGTNLVGERKETHTTNILIHNNRENTQSIYVKVLVAKPTKLKSVWLSKDKIEIKPDGAVDIDCADIRKILELKLDQYSKGLLVILQQVPVPPSTTVAALPQPVLIPLDVMAAYTYVIEGGGGANKQVKTIHGVLVPQIPLPP